MIYVGSGTEEGAPDQTVHYFQDGVSYSLIGNALSSLRERRGEAQTSTEPDGVEALIYTESDVREIHDLESVIAALQAACARAKEC